MGALRVPVRRLDVTLERSRETCAGYPTEEVPVTAMIPVTVPLSRPGRSGPTRRRRTGGSRLPLALQGPNTGRLPLRLAGVLPVDRGPRPGDPQGDAYPDRPVRPGHGGARTSRVHDRPPSLDGLRCLPPRPHRRPHRRQPAPGRPPSEGPSHTGTRLDRAELGAFLFAAERHDAALAVLLGLNGLRMSEACSADIENRCVVVAFVAGG